MVKKNIVRKAIKTLKTTSKDQNSRVQDSAAKEALETLRITLLELMEHDC